jgi:DNA-binding NtrC family response regulator
MQNVDARDLPPMKSLAGLEILLVEDETLIAMDAEMMLMEMGAARVLTVASSEEALCAVETSPPDFVVLDIKLEAGTSLGVAEELLKKKIPFIFATGYGETPALPESMNSIPVIGKPYDMHALTQAVAAIDKF